MFPEDVVAVEGHVHLVGGPAPALRVEPGDALADLRHHVVVLLHGVVHLVSVWHGEQHLLAHKRSPVRGEGGEDGGGECWTNSLQAGEGVHSGLQVVSLGDGSEGFLGEVHHHPRRVHLDQILQLLAEDPHVQFPLHALDNLLVGQISVFATTFDLLGEIIVVPLVQLQDGLRLGVLALSLGSKCLLVFLKHELELFAGSLLKEIRALQTHLAGEMLSELAPQNN